MIKPEGNGSPLFSFQDKNIIEVGKRLIQD